MVAADHPERVEAIAYIGPAVPLAPGLPERQVSFEDELDTDEGWAKYNRHYWLRDYKGFLEYFFAQMFNEPHSTKQIEDCVNWGLETDPETLADTTAALSLCGTQRFADIAARVSVPGARDPRRPGPDPPVRPGRRAGEGDRRRAGHARGLRPRPAGARPDQGQPAAARVRRARSAPRAAPGPAAAAAASARCSSPPPSASATRAATSRSPRSCAQLHPDLEIDWLAQNPVTRVLEAEGERVHPASALLANESAHIESESAEHDLHCFQAWRRMDEILVANFMVFDDLVREESYDLWIGDEAWELDYYLHENPELKRAAYVWLTDFVGWLPVEEEGHLTTDYNAEMIEHIDRFPRIRDRALFVGNPDDVVPDTFGADLPAIRDWTERHFDFPGYVTGFQPGRKTARSCARNSATSRTSRCASSRSAVRASARTCCGA